MKRYEFLLVSSVLMFSAASCTKRKPSYATEVDKHSIVARQSLQVDLAPGQGSAASTPNQSLGSLPQGPLLSTDPNCRDAAKSERGHSPGEGMNHCPKDINDPDSGPTQFGSR